MQKQKYIIVYRCSREEQSTKGNSLETQKMICDNHPRLKEMHKVAEYEEVISSWKENKRGVLEEIYRRCKRNPKTCEYVIYQKVDRFFRNTGRAWEWIEKFKKLGIQINFVEQWIMYGSGGERLMLNIRLGIAEEESFNTSRRIKQNLIAIKKAGYYTGSKAPVGWTKFVTRNHRKTLKPVTDKLKVLEHVFKSYLYGNVTRSYFLDDAKAIGLSKTQFYNTFQNPIYAGVNLVKDEEGENVYYKADWNEYAIITPDEYEIIQERIKVDSERKEKTITKQKDYWLKGHIFCERTGKKMTASASTGNNPRKKYKYYHAKKGTSLRVDATHQLIYKMFSKIKIDNKFVEQAKQKIHEQIKTRKKEQQEKRSSAQREIIKIQARLDVFKKMLLAGEIEAPEFSEYKGYIEEAIQEKEKVISEMQNQSFLNDRVLLEALKIIPKFEKLFKSYDMPLKQQMIRTLFPHGFTVNLKKQRVETIYFNNIMLQIIDNESVMEILEIKTGENVNFARTVEMKGLSSNTSKRDIMNLVQLIAMIA